MYVRVLLVIQQEIIGFCFSDRFKTNAMMHLENEKHNFKE